MKKTYVIFASVIVFIAAIYLLSYKQINVKHSSASVISNADTMQHKEEMKKESTVSDKVPVGIDWQNEIEELAKNNSNIMPVSEYDSVDEYINSYVASLNRENKEQVGLTDKYTYELHITTTAQEYAKHFLELTDSQIEQEKLKQIVEITNVVFEKMKENQLDDTTLESAFNELRDTMNRY
ncbi:hypothetical protein [Ornithinibacillus xuwenensis]|uniref:Uncharacterized protein n=1 Tax=Ornithinibacillus xuwenensis TaxID=3144668 RepID=A0ABU9XGL5_9BACI